MSDYAAIFLAPAVATFGAFAWAVARLFLRAQVAPRMQVISILGPIFFVIDIICVSVAPVDWPYILVATVMDLIALTLFLWAASTTADRRLTLAFSDDLPVFLLTDGPYRYVRHPFYAAYIAFWLANCLASRTPWPLIGLVVMALLYVRALREEEAKFEATGLAEAYAEYRRTTGALVPRIVRRGGRP